MRNLPLFNRYKEMPKSVKASLWFIICSILQKGIAFITTPIFTRLMTTEQYGQVTIYNSWLEIFTIFATINLFYGVYNNALNKYPEDRDSSTSSMLGLCSTITIIVFLVYIVLRNLINRLTGMSTLMTCLLFGEVLFIPAFRFWAAKQRFEYKYKLLVLFTLLISLLTAFLGVPAVILSENKGMAKIITSVVSQVIIALVLYILLFIRGKRFYSRNYWRWALSFNLPLIPHYLSSVILNQSDRIMIDRLVGKSEAGIYGLAYTIGSLIIIFNEAIMNSFTPWTYQHLKTEDFVQVRNVTNYLTIFIGIFAIALILIAPEVMLVIGGEQYSPGTMIIAPIALSIFFRFLYSLYGNIEFYYEENYFIMIASILIAVLNILLNYIFINMYGYLAAGFTTLLCFILYSFSHYIFSRIVLKKHGVKSRIYNNKFILLVSLVVISSSFVIMTLYNYAFIRYGVLIFIIVLLVVFRKKILSIINKIRGKNETII